MKPNGKKQKKGRGFSLLPSRQKSLFVPILGQCVIAWT